MDQPVTGSAVKNRRHSWTMTHSFFALMGGFVVQDPHDPDNRYLPSWQGNGFLSHDGVLFLLKNKPHLLPDIPLVELRDRGKADSIAKVLLMWQVLWFILSCINRGVQGLPLCLLEVTTIAHAICALLTYLLWWSKPKDVGEPVYLGRHSEHPNSVKETGAWMSSRSHAYRAFFCDSFAFSHESEFSATHGKPKETWRVWRIRHDHPDPFPGPGNGNSFSSTVPSVRTNFVRWGR